MMLGGDYCQAQVSEPPWYIRTHQCSRKAKTVVNGKRYCTQHAKIETKRSERRASAGK